MGSPKPQAGRNPCSARLESQDCCQSKNFPPGSPPCERCRSQVETMHRYLRSLLWYRCRRVLTGDSPRVRWMQVMEAMEAMEARQVGEVCSEASLQPATTILRISIENAHISFASNRFAGYASVERHARFARPSSDGQPTAIRLLICRRPCRIDEWKERSTCKRRTALHPHRACRGVYREGPPGIDASSQVAKSDYNQKTASMGFGWSGNGCSGLVVGAESFEEKRVCDRSIFFWRCP